MFGNDSAGARYAAVGMFALGDVANGSQPVTGGEEDINDSWNCVVAGSDYRRLAGADSTPATGRGTYSITTASGTVELCLLRGFNDGIGCG